MKTRLAAFTIPLFVSLGAAAGPALAQDRLVIQRDVVTFAVLPDGVRFPEGITANPANGDIYVGTFDGGNQNKLLRYNRHGHLVATRDFGITRLLGLEFDRAHKKVYVLNVGDFTGVPGLDSKIQRIAADFNSTTPIEDVAVIPPIGAPNERKVVKGDKSVDTVTFGDNARVPNAMVFDSHGNLYVSDSFQGAIFELPNVAGCSKTCNVETFSHDPLLATPGFPPFGANGLAFDNESGLLWVCTNQADEVVALNANGRVVAKLGEFRGINRNGTPDGLLFPASPVIVGDEIFVTNLAIALTDAKGDEPEEDVTRWTVTRMKLPDRKD